MNITETCIVPKSCRERFMPLEGDFAAPLVDRGVNFSGISDLRAPYRIARRDPSFHLFIATLGGRGGYETSEGNRSLEPGDLWIAPARQPQHYWAEEEWRVIFFHLDAKSATIPSGRVPVSASSFSRQLEAVMTWYINEVFLDTARSRVLAKSYAEIMAVCLDREIERFEFPEQHRVRLKLDQLWSEVSASLNSTWTVEAMARRVSLSAAQFRRVVQTHNGRSPQEILQKLRIERTQQLLRRSDDSLSQIAERVGYESPFSLSRAFKRLCGISPRDFRKRSYRA